MAKQQYVTILSSAEDYEWNSDIDNDNVLQTAAYSAVFISFVVEKILSIKLVALLS